MKHRRHALAALAATSLLLSGCATAAGSVTPVAAEAPLSSSAAGESAHAGGHSHGSSSHPGTPQAAGPSDAARMVCGDQPMDRLTAILDLDSKPHTVDKWADNTFTCTYHLKEGSLEISVREAKDQASALTYFNAMQALAKDASPIEGLANLGFPAYETGDGSAVFQKDSFVLQVDASDLPATLGPEGVSRNALAYQLSTTILACWVKHP
ncbi:hypothetical protein [Arthrobacter sp. B3I4]|uniref:hypothetical protein n=1 Tax=Arthrobacter sp. B3I4 TaxID=3042267 RepID=UPI0027878EE0|nr:hypothetical protein [Arthrobacter sp. B3I4]MDQ0755195.1 hypothetical protein [Arthrobacter sp. B3I4]